MTTTVCHHCGLPAISAGAVIGMAGGEERTFCCSGCMKVSQAIYAAGLESYYLIAREEGVGAPPPEAADALVFDMPEIQEEFVSSCGTGEEKEAGLLLEGIHCAACVWLIERAMASAPGVEKAEVNLAARRLNLRWDSAKTSLSTIVSRLSAIGYAAEPYTWRSAGESAKRQLRASLFRIGFAGFATMNMMWIAIALWTGAAEGEYRDFFRWTGLMLATATLGYSGAPFYIGAWKGLRGKALTMDLPIAIGASATYLYSLYVTLSPNLAGAETYFDTVTAFIFVISIGRHLELTSRLDAADSSARMMEMAPKTATIVDQNGERVIAARTLKPGNTMILRPGQRAAADGIVVEGESQMDESLFTGESRPVEKKGGSQVYTGALNGHGALLVKVTAASRETSLARLAKVMDEAQASRATVQRIADRIVPWFTLATLGAAAAAFAWWYKAAGLETAVMNATATLIITCPCALGMATPMAVAVAAGAAAKRGIFVRHGAALEAFSKVSAFMFDKTGSLTEGKLAVTEVALANGMKKEELLRLAAAAEKYSEHPAARAIVRAFEEEPPQSEGFAAAPGRGARAMVAGSEVLAGSILWMAENGVAVPEKFERLAAIGEAKGQSTVFVAAGGALAGYIGVADQPRADAADTLELFRKAGVEITMLTGDSAGVAAEISKMLGGVQFIAGMSPEEKVAAVAKASDGDRVVAMAGDGVNDAPALARATVSIAMESGADISVAGAGIVISGGSLMKIWEAYSLALGTMGVIRQNLTMSLLYNLVMAPLAMAGYVTPVVAALAMPVSSLAVIWNARRIGGLWK